jgi:hypothetical protein
MGAERAASASSIRIGKVTGVRVAMRTVPIDGMAASRRAALRRARCSSRAIAAAHDHVRSSRAEDASAGSSASIDRAPSWPTNARARAEPAVHRERSSRSGARDPDSGGEVRRDLVLDLAERIDHVPRDLA